MKARTYSNSLATRIAVILLSAAMVFTMMPTLGGSYSYGADSLAIKTPAVVVTGQGLLTEGKYSTENVSNEKSYTLDELKALDGVKGEIYSAKKSQEPYTKLYSIVDGVKLTSLVPNLARVKGKISVVASDGYAAVFDNDVAYDNDGKAKNAKPGIASGRYFYDGFTSSETKEVPSVLSWAYDDVEGVDGAAPTSKPSATKAKNYLRLFVGQYKGTNGNNEDMNAPLFNGKDGASINKIVVGDAVDEVVLTVGSKNYTRADLLLLPYAEYTYSYTSKKGDMNDTVRGVPFSVLLKDSKANAKVSFAAADGYDMSKSTMTVRDLNKGKYMLAYAIQDDGEWKGIYETAKDDSSIYGFLTLYGDNGKSPSKLINKVSTSDGGIDFGSSNFKHITNGGISGLDTPYNIDAITGATLTIEGPGTKASVPLSVRDLEGQDAGCFRGNYTDTRNGKKVTRTYEGVDLYYILTKMSSGDNGIKLTDEAKKVVIKNRNRKTISTFKLSDVKKLSQAKTPILVAYGTAMKDKPETAKPFVFDGEAGGSKSLGNYDGCLKLVYNKSKVSGNKNYKKFANMAYIYVEESARPGYKHNKSPYKSAENSQYVLTLTGKEIGREVNFTVQQLENMVKYDKNGKVKKNKYAYRDDYSLANSTYWYVNEYEGVKLWSLLQSAGIKNSKKNDKNTLVTFKSTDNYGGFDKFSLYQVAHPNCFGFYEKNAADPGDGTYKGVASDLKKKGFPVLVAYGVNGYPYVKDKKLKGYKSGLQNDGGPLRVISGKMDYSHANGSNQAKLLDKVIVGSDDYHYATHKYHEKNAYTSLANQTITVDVKSGDKTLKTQTYTVGDIEELLYSGDLSANQMLEAKVKAFYETKNGKKFANNLYEGLNLNYFLQNVVELPGIIGDVTFTSTSGKKLTLDLQKVLNTSNGYNKATKLSGLSPVLAYAKNGAPLVTSKKAAGYEGKITLAKGTSYARKYNIYNNGGPLKVVFPRASKTAKSTMGSLNNLMSITIDLTPDNYSHTDAPYDTLAGTEITIGGEGTRLTEPKKFTVSDLEGKQTLIQTVDYSVMNASGEVTQERYRGVPLYDLLKDTSVSLKNSANEVIVTGTNGSKHTFLLSELIDSKYVNTVTGTKKLPIMLAYGSASASNKDKADGKPLVKATSDTGYDAVYNNAGGPIKLVVGQIDANDKNVNNMVINVKSIEVTAKASDSWNHSSNPVFEQYLKETVVLKVVDSNGTEKFNHTYTVADLEKMTDLILKDTITSTQDNEWEGLDFWKFVEKETKAACPEATTAPIKVMLKAKSDGFSIDVLAKASLDGLQNGVKDGTRYVPIMLGYGMDGLPLTPGDKSDTKIYDGFDSVIGNNGGPIRLLVHKSQGSCLTGICEITITVK